MTHLESSRKLPPPPPAPERFSISYSVDAHDTGMAELDGLVGYSAVFTMRDGRRRDGVICGSAHLGSEGWAAVAWIDIAEAYSTSNTQAESDRWSDAQEAALEGGDRLERRDYRVDKLYEDVVDIEVY